MSAYLEVKGRPEVTKDFSGLRKVIRRYVVHGAVADDPAQLEAQVFLPYGTTDAAAHPTLGGTFSLALLVTQKLERVAEGDAVLTMLVRVFDEFPESGGNPAKVSVGGDKITYDEYNRQTLVRQYVCLASQAESLRVPIGNTTEVAGLVCTRNEIQMQGIGAVIVATFVQATGTMLPLGPDDIDYELNGLKRRTRTLIGTPAAVFDITQNVVGVSLHPSDTTLILAGYKIDENVAVKTVKLTYMQPGIVEADKKFDEEGGMLFVTFQSVGTKFTPTCKNPAHLITADPRLAFQGGAPAVAVRDRIQNINGLRTFTVTVMMLITGSSIVGTGAGTVVKSYEDWISYQKPGTIEADATGFTPIPGAQRYVKAKVEESLTTVSTLAPATKPYTVTKWASLFYRYKPADGGATVSSVKGASGYLADASQSSSSPTTFMGEAVTSYSIDALSDPTPADFMSANNVVLSCSLQPAFTTDDGVQWYRKRIVTLVGAFTDYLS
jgi:hypothetical protein